MQKKLVILILALAVAVAFSVPAYCQQVTDIPFQFRDGATAKVIMVGRGGIFLPRQHVEVVGLTPASPQRMTTKKENYTLKVSKPEFCNETPRNYMGHFQTKMEEERTTTEVTDQGTQVVHAASGAKRSLVGDIFGGIGGCADTAVAVATGGLGGGDIIATGGVAEALAKNRNSNEANANAEATAKAKSNAEINNSGNSKVGGKGDKKGHGHHKKKKGGDC